MISKLLMLLLHLIQKSLAFLLLRSVCIIFVTVKQNRQFIKTILSLNKTRLKDLKFVLYGIFAYIVRAFIFYKHLEISG